MSLVRRPFQLITILSLVCCFIGCSEAKRGDRKETSEVTGTVTVDGQPAADVQVKLESSQPLDPNEPIVPAGVTDSQGVFKITTYELGDGAPIGDYTATFTWPQLQLNQAVEPVDRLKKRYSNAATSTYKVKVESGKATDMGKIDLTTK